LTQKGIAVGENILELKNITKLYPGVKALNQVSISFQKGEIHALVGENGAGKSTLIKTVSGAIAPTAGEICIEKQSFKALTPAVSRENGIAVVYQEFTLVPVLSVTENIFLGEFIHNNGICDKKAMKKKTEQLFQSLGVFVDPNTKVEELTTGYQQIVEIAKAVSKNAKILIMDEPSAPLTNNETEAMFQIVGKLKNEGVTIIYISHRLEEIFRLADRVTVLRDGNFIGTKKVAETNKEELIRMMVGRTLRETYPERNLTHDEMVLSVKNLTGNGVKNISFDLKKGEILGFGGLVGAGRTETAELLFGNGKIKSGEIYLKGRNIKPSSPREAIREGICLVPEDRKLQGLILDMTLKENLSMSVLKKLSSKLMLNSRAVKKFAQQYIDNLSIKTPGIEQKVKNLSGGNQQKVVLGKCLGVEPDILIFDEPTRGIDVGAKHEIYKIMVKLVKSGKSVIMISSEMEELMGMSDRMVIFSKGRQTGILNREEFTQEKILKFFAEVVEDEV